jgi:competence protein ComEA
VALGRTGALAIVGLGALGAGVGAWALWPSAKPSLDCALEDIRVDDAGTVVCAPGAPPSPVAAGPGITLGIRLDLNRASADELALVQGIGPALAKALVDARQASGGFKGWDEVDRVPGMGPSKLAALKAVAEIR